MYKELLLPLTKGMRSHRFKPSCSPEEIFHGQKELHLLFPQELCFMLREFNGDNRALLSVKDIIDVNLDLKDRMEKYFVYEKFRPDLYRDNVEEFLFFAKNGSGDFFAYRLDVNRHVTDTSVYIWEHELISKEKCYRKVCANLLEFIQLFYTGNL